jgi:hypothetical protein
MPTKRDADYSALGSDFLAPHENQPAANPSANASAIHQINFMKR